MVIFVAARDSDGKQSDLVRQERFRPFVPLLMVVNEHLQVRLQEEESLDDRQTRGLAFVVQSPKRLSFELFRHMGKGQHGKEAHG